MQALGFLPSFWRCSSCLSFSWIIDGDKVSPWLLLCAANVKPVPQSLCAVWLCMLPLKLPHSPLLNAFQSKRVLAYLLSVLTVVLCVGIWIYATPGAGRTHAYSSPTA